MSYDASLIKKAKQELVKRAKIELSRRNLIDFTFYLNPSYETKWFHLCIANELDKVQRRETKKLMLFVPPQHGKSELSSRNFPAFCLGRNPNEKIAIVSYSSTIAEGFGKAVQRKIEEHKYRELFPNTLLSGGRDGISKTNSFFEIQRHNGYVISVGRGGSLTSKSVDIGIVDDPLKDRQEAQSLTVRENLWSWFTDVFETRLHNESVQVLIQTRWHEDDLAGRLLLRDGKYSKDNPNGWVVIKFPAIREKDINNYDPRNEGEALWHERHSLEKLERVRDTSPLTFNSLYQQDPKPSVEGLVFGNWAECDEFPEDAEVIFSGMDFGFTNDPTTLTRIARIGNRLYVDELLYETGLTNPQIAQRIKAFRGKIGEIYADSAEPKSIRELQNLGVQITPATKGQDSIDAGIQKLKEFEVYITKKSKNILKERNNYQWMMVGGKATNRPIDSHNHSMDGIRYAVFTKYGKPSFFFL